MILVLLTYIKFIGQKGVISRKKIKKPWLAVLETISQYWTGSVKNGPYRRENL